MNQRVTSPLSFLLPLVPSNGPGRVRTEDRCGSADISLESPQTFSPRLVGDSTDTQSGGYDAGQRCPWVGLRIKQEARGSWPGDHSFPILWGLAPVCHLHGRCLPFSPRPVSGLVSFNSKNVPNTKEEELWDCDKGLSPAAHARLQATKQAVLHAQ